MLTDAHIPAYLASSWAFLQAEADASHEGWDERLHSAAGEVLVHHDGALGSVSELHAGIVAAVFAGRGTAIPEVGEAEEARRCFALAAALDRVAGRALLTYSGYLGRSLAKIEEQALAARTDAYRGLYGEEAWA